MTGAQLSRATISRLNALFAGPDRPEAERLLVERCGNNLPACKSADAVALERIRFAALKLSKGDLSALRRAVSLANIDWRDLLVAAEFAADIHAHASWFPSGDTP